MMLGLPDTIRACLFDLDGVLTKTAILHAKSWKTMFDAFLKTRGEPFVPFDPVHDYDAYVDGKPRDEGTRSFLEARHIELPEGGDDDPPGKETIHGLGARKNEIFRSLLEKGEIETYEGSVRFVKEARAAGLRTAVVSSSANCKAVLEAAGIEDLFELRIDGAVAKARKLPGKPHPDTYLAGAEGLGIAKENAAVFEDALAGVEAGRAGKFGYVVGVDRVGQADDLKAHGADVVVKDLAELLGAKPGATGNTGGAPGAEATRR